MRTANRTTAILRRTVAALAAIATILGSAAAQADERFANLRAEISAQQMHFPPNKPILARFTLFNSGDEPIEIPFRRSEGDDGVRLPLSLVFGGENESALTAVYEGDKSATLRSAESTPPGVETTLKLAARGSVGVEIDLRNTAKLMRYSGGFRIEWKPLGGAAAATLEIRVEQRKMAFITTDYGKLTVQLDYESAPQNVENFVDLARQKFYDGLTFHRLVPNLLIQGGAPGGAPSGMRPDGKTTPPEFTAEPFVAGVLAMARKPDVPNSASCQFFITLARVEELDGKYTIVGRATDAESLRTLQALNELPTDERDRPLKPIVIRDVSLADATDTPAASPPAAARP